jgi:hypothetical protein
MTEEEGEVRSECMEEETTLIGKVV